VDPTRSCSWRRLVACLAGVLVMAGLAGCTPPQTATKSAAEASQPPPRGLAADVAGRTQCVPARQALIAPVPLHPVVEVPVAPGDRVTKGQALVKLDDDEAQADVRAKQAALENAQHAAKEARRHFTAVDKAFEKGALPEQRYHEIRTTALKAEGDERMAMALLDSAKAELEHFVIRAPIDGVVNRLDVRLGMVSRPGTTVWGEILDLSEIDVRCEVTPDQADQVVVGQTAEVWNNSKKNLVGKGRVVFVGLSADKATGLVPVLVRLANSEGRLRCEIPVQVRFTAGKPQ
jgi:membrane fusion protein, multidrug efflux system